MMTELTLQWLFLTLQSQSGGELGSPLRLTAAHYLPKGSRSSKQHRQTHPGGEARHSAFWEKRFGSSFWGVGSAGG